MTELILTTFDWVPEGPRGFVRDLRVRWALEEAGLPYRVESTPFHERGADHYQKQAFGQVPWLTDGDISLFETGAILMYLADKYPGLIPTEPKGRAEAMQWLFAALNSLEMASMPRMILQFAEIPDDDPSCKRFDEFLDSRMTHMEAVLKDREWLAGTFSIADIQMAEAMRSIWLENVLQRFPACEAYVARANARPAFKKAHADQLAHFAAAD
jgi:glutathione S-transferase